MERPSKKETTFVTSAQERLINKKKKKNTWFAKKL
jgi:hypothetical protein